MGKWVQRYLVMRVEEKKIQLGGGSLSQRAKHSPYVPELGSQLVSETGKDILTIPLGGTEPVLYRIS
jgi:hypothetical protein